MKSIVAFSGGIDSVYALWKELTETTNDVLAVYFVMPPIMPKFRIKAMMPRQQSFLISKKVKEIALAIQAETRPFEMLVTDYDISKALDPQFNINHATVLMTHWAIDRINAGTADRFVSGLSHDNDGFANGSKDSMETETGSSLTVKAFQTYAKRGEYALPCMEDKYTFAKAYSELPQTISSLNLSCEQRSEDGPCGFCYKCSMHKLSIQNLNNGVSTDKFFDYVMSKSVKSDDIWCSPKKWLAEEVDTYRSTVENDWPMRQWGRTYKVPE